MGWQTKVWKPKSAQWNIVPGVTPGVKAAPRSENLTNGNLDRTQDLQEQLRAATSIANASNLEVRQQGWTKVKYQPERARAKAEMRALKEQIADLKSGRSSS